jgi:hypothetical protein
MWKPWNSGPGFAALGLKFAGASYLWAFLDYTKAMGLFSFLVTSLSIILCPADCEVSGWDGFTTYSIIGLLNTVLYAAIGYMVLAARKRQTHRWMARNLPRSSEETSSKTPA